MLVPCLDNCIAAACVYGCLYDTCASAALCACLLYLLRTMPAVFVHSAVTMLPILVQALPYARTYHTRCRLFLCTPKTVSLCCPFSFNTPAIAAPAICMSAA
ncbi:unnamed protein product [Laminaria digitata]